MKYYLLANTILFILFTILLIYLRIELYNGNMIALILSYVAVDLTIFVIKVKV